MSKQIIWNALYTYFYKLENQWISYNRKLEEKYEKEEITSGLYFYIKQELKKIQKRIDLIHLLCNDDHREYYANENYSDYESFIPFITELIASLPCTYDFGNKCIKDFEKELIEINNKPLTEEDIQLKELLITICTNTCEFIDILPNVKTNGSK